MTKLVMGSCLINFGDSCRVRGWEDIKLLFGTICHIHLADIDCGLVFMEMVDCLKVETMGGFDSSFDLRSLCWWYEKINLTQGTHKKWSFNL